MQPADKIIQSAIQVSQFNLNPTIKRDKNHTYRSLPKTIQFKGSTHESEFYLQALAEAGVHCEHLFCFFLIHPYRAAPPIDCGSQ